MIPLYENYRSPWLNEELDMLRDAARRFFEREFKPHNERWLEQGEIDRDAWNKAGEAGLLCAEMPERYGGAGGDYRHETVVMEEFLRQGLTGFGYQVHSSIVAPYILRYGNEAQRQRWLPKMATGEMVGAIAMTEPHTGSDLQNVRTAAVRDGDDYIINGAKTYITNGQHADLVIVVAKTDPSQGAKGISLNAWCATLKAASTPPPPPWPSIGVPRPNARSSTSASSCTAAPVTWTSTRFRECTPTPACRRSTAAPTKS